MSVKRSKRSATRGPTCKVKGPSKAALTTAVMSVTEIEDLITGFNPEDFLSGNEKVSSTTLALLKKLYDFTKCSENQGSLEDPLGLLTAALKNPIANKTRKKKQAAISKAEAPLSQLITKDFDEDQVWEEVQLQNGLMYDNLVTSVSKLLAYQDKSMEDDLSDDDGESDENEPFPTDLMDERGRGGHEKDDSDFFESDEKYREISAKQTGAAKKYPKSVVDDKFFSLAQMTEHIEQVEAEMEKSGIKKFDDHDQDDSFDEESIDMFEDVPSSEEEEKEDVQEYYYKDFFDPPLDAADLNQTQEYQDDERDDNDNNEDDEKRSFDKKVQFNFEEDENEGDERSGDSEGDMNDESIPKNDKQLGKKINDTLSSFEQRQMRIEENIEEIEKAALEPKSWHLLGEATAESRPENALLEEHLIYDHLIRPAPEITVEVTHKLEDVIKQRLKDGAWDDVIRKVKPIEDPREYKKRLVMDAEKGKTSLAEIYEQEYLDKQKAEEGEIEEKEPEEHIQIKKDLRSLFSKLDALSHYHYTPKPPPPEVKIVANIPAIQMEDIAPISVSDAMMLAPREIQEQAKGPIKSKEERSATDRKRERRKKKKIQHLKKLMQEEKARIKGLGLRNIKLADGIVRSQEKAKSIKDSDTDQKSKELKSSKAFFAKLQETVTSHISNVAKRKANPKQSDNISAKRYKL